METFWECCGARPPLILEVEVDGDSSVLRYGFDRPFLLIGRGERSDLVLDHPDVSRRHAYLQVIAGWLFCVDLESRTGTDPGDGNPVGGWHSPDRPIRIGPYSIRVRVDATSAEVESTPSNPLLTRGLGADPWTETNLEFQSSATLNPVRIARTLSLIGRSSRCKIQLDSSAFSRFHAALLRTARGTWAIDLRSSDRLQVNGACLDYARLEAGDELRIGKVIARVAGSSKRIDPVLVPSALAESVGSRAILQTFEPSVGDLQAILDQVANIQDQSNDQFRQMILMVTQLFGSMHRETMELVRDELEEIRNLAGELKALRQESAWGRMIESAPAASPQLNGANPGEYQEAKASTPRDPGEIHLIVSERLAAFERERRGRWSTLSKILSKNDG